MKYEAPQDTKTKIKFKETIQIYFSMFIFSKSWLIYSLYKYIFEIY